MSQKKEDRLASLRNARRKKDRRRPGHHYHLVTGKRIEGFYELEERVLKPEGAKSRECLSQISEACEKKVVGGRGARICRTCRSVLNYLGVT